MARGARRAGPPAAIEAAAREPMLERHAVEMLVHDLQNPLSGIMAFLEILRERPEGLSEAEGEGLGAALQRCRELSELVFTMLQLGRAEKGELRPELEIVDLEQVARSAVDAFAPVAERGRQKLRFKASPGASALALTDERILRRILDNLTRNALRHTPPGTAVELAVERKPSLRIVVEDDGPGIPEAIQHQVFEPGALRRAGVPTDSGIGLAYCRKAAAALGMSLYFEQSGSGGCRFILAAREPAPEEKPGRASSKILEAVFA